MRSLRVFVLGLLFAFVVGIGAAAAAPVAATTALPFIWVRAAPSSNAYALYTVYPTYYATLETTGNTQWDGYQTWAEVYVINNGNIRGWVEQGSLVAASQNAPQYAPYNTPYNPAQYPSQYQNQYPSNPYNNYNAGRQPWWGGNTPTYQGQGAPWNGNNGWNTRWRHR